MGCLVAKERSFFSSQVDGAIARAARESHAYVLPDVLIDLKVRTTRCDYLWLDRYGVLAIDVQEWPGAQLRGTQSSRQWSAAAKGSRRAHFSNPLQQGVERRMLLLDALLSCGRRLSHDYVQTLTVFTGSDLTKLRLDDTQRSRCVDVSALEAFLKSREDFPPNAGIIEPHQLDDLHSLLRMLDRSEDEDAVVRHEGSTRVVRRSLPFSRPEPTKVMVADAKLGAAPRAPRITDRYPAAAVAKPKSALPVLLLILLILLPTWLFLLGGTQTLGAQLGMLSQFLPGYDPNGTQALTAPTQPGDDGVDRAVAVLQEYAPDVAASAVNLHTPTVTFNGDSTAYTWVYRRPDGSPTPGTMTLTFDDVGTLRGAERR